MENLIKKYFLILLFLSIFTFDKLFSIPFIQNYFTIVSPISFFESIKNNILVNEEKLKLAIQSKKKIVFIFGSSTSYGFYFNESDYFNSILQKNLDLKNKKNLNQFEIFNFSYAGATVISHLVRLEQILERGYKPDLILLELAASSFNTNNSFYEAEISESLTFSFILKNFSWIPKEHISKNFLKKFFLLSKLKLDFSMTNQKQIFNQYRMVMNLGLKIKKIPESFEVGEEKLGFYLSNQYMIQNFKENFKNFKVSPEMILYFHKIIELINKNQIPVFYFHTAVHPLVNEVIQETSIPTEWKSFLEKEKLKNFYDLNQDKFCTNFMDPLHMGIPCYIKMYPILIKELRL